MQQDQTVTSHCLSYQINQRSKRSLVILVNITESKAGNKSLKIRHNQIGSTAVSTLIAMQIKAVITAAESGG
jgi:GrpB-like predicted nucleotidyltransferase (UPF0157 family)